MEVGILTQNEVIWWICPVCNWGVSGLVMEYCIDDIDCGKCGLRKLSEFEPVAFFLNRE